MTGWYQDAPSWQLLASITLKILTRQTREIFLSSLDTDSSGCSVRACPDLHSLQMRNYSLDRARPSHMPILQLKSRSELQL